MTFLVYLCLVVLSFRGFLSVSNVYVCFCELILVPASLFGLGVLRLYQGKVECWDPRIRHRVGLLDCALSSITQGTE